MPIPFNYDSDNTQDNEKRKFQPDSAGNTAVNVISKNIEDQLTAILDALGITPGESLFLDFDGLVSGNALVDLISYTVPASTVASFSHLEISCRIESVVRVEKNGVLIGSCRTGAAMPTAKFDWSPKRFCVTGDVVKVRLMKRANTPDIDVSAHLMGTITTT